MALFKCKICGGDLEIAGDASVAKCQYCGTQQTLPRLDSDRRANLYDRANHFRRNNEFDKAMALYESILNEDGTDAEAYWSLVLCRYGIEYVEDPDTHRRVPTVNRAQLTSVFADENYKQALAHADESQRALYEAEAKVIDDLQKEILKISSQEEPFDVFICYKETDENGQRTRDSVLANDLYHELTEEGFKVFFSRITLEGKLGTAYEPYIFAALHSAKVMVAIGTRPEYFNAPWVKNEWSRYLALIKNGEKKSLIPAYRDMDPYDLPEEFSHLQAQDMSKLGFMQDLIRGIEKLSEREETTPVHEVIVSSIGGQTDIEPLLKRVFLFLKDREWQNADAYCERVLDRDPENAMAYVGKLMAQLQLRRQGDLACCTTPYLTNKNYEKALRFADDDLRKTLEGYFESAVQCRKEAVYQQALHLMESAQSIEKFQAAAEQFASLRSWKDAEARVEQCNQKVAELVQAKADAESSAIYDAASRTLQEAGTEGECEWALKQFKLIADWQDSKSKMEECRQKKEKLIHMGKKKQRIAILQSILVCLVIALIVFLFYRHRAEIFPQYASHAFSPQTEAFCPAPYSGTARG